MTSCGFRSETRTPRKQDEVDQDRLGRMRVEAQDPGPKAELGVPSVFVLVRAEGERTFSVPPALKKTSEILGEFCLLTDSLRHLFA